MNKTKFLVQSAVIAALYTTITIAFAPFSYGLLQIRLSEALTILPFFTPAAIPGLFIGVIISNIMGGFGLLDIVLGSSATLIAAIMTYKIKRDYLAPVPPIVVNAIVIGAMLSYILNVPLLGAMAWVGLGQLIACYGIGYPLIKYLEKYRNQLFKL